MKPDAIPDLSREKLQAGRLPLNSMPRFWSGPADGKACDMCDKRLTNQQLVMDVIAPTLTNKKQIQFHVTWTRTPFESRTAKTLRDGTLVASATRLLGRPARG
jgi:hypothetical protein